jgi:hypothetical protein
MVILSQSTLILGVRDGSVYHFVFFVFFRAPKGIFYVL